MNSTFMSKSIRSNNCFVWLDTQATIFFYLKTPCSKMREQYIFVCVRVRIIQENVKKHK